jgi:hypothetical protein
MPRCFAADALALTLSILLPPLPGREPMPLLNPVNLTALNTPSDEDDPHLSADRLRLYYASNASGRFTLFLAERRNLAQPWSPGKPLSGPTGESDDRCPCLTIDGHDLYFATRFVVKAANKELKEFPDNFDIVHAIKLIKPHEFTVPTPVQAVCTAADEMFPWVSWDGRELYFSRKTSAGWRVLVARRPGNRGAFTDPKLLEELPAGFHHTTLSRDGRTMYLQGPLGNSRWGLFRCTRPGPAMPWSKPEPLDGLNSPAAPTGDTSPCLAADGTKLYFASDRPGGKGGRDLWVIDTGVLPRPR